MSLREGNFHIGSIPAISIWERILSRESFFGEGNDRFRVLSGEGPNDLSIESIIAEGLFDIFWDYLKEPSIKM